MYFAGKNAVKSKIVKKLQNKIEQVSILYLLRLGISRRNVMTAKFISACDPLQKALYKKTIKKT